ncbi:EC protein III-like [Alnus glutinosa]|uniref:EC protein III-like n=1 Tax=Alnus glutinosa TaxID=3517 RepID=UPI002D776394|nr:EC protein III-like [Alnus glutinosa]
MADTRGRGDVVSCNDKCGCSVPCPGGVTCRCTPTSVGYTAAGGDHKICSCGDHCGCSPCTCLKSVETTGSGKAFCKCGEGCTCAACNA